MGDAPLVVMALREESAGAFEELSIPVLYTGVGKVNAAYSLTRALHGYRARGEPLPNVVNFGTAGSSRFRAHTLVGCHRFLQRDMDVRALGFGMGETPFDAVPHVLEFPPVFHHLPEAVCGSADRFETLAHDELCDVVDMEAYALAKVCHLEGASFVCAKFVSDGADGGAAADWTENVAKAAAEFVRLYRALRG